MKCRSINKNINKVCIGDFNHRIKIQTTSIIANNAPDTLSTVGFTTVAEVWAMIKTNTAREFIDGVNVENGLNTDFYIRHNSLISFSQQLWIEYESNLFKITNIDNIDKDNKIIRLRAIEKGDKAINANKR